MVYSFTQISQYLCCPRSYRYRYLDGWREKETRAAMAFGRSFESALSAFFRREDPGAALFTDWGAHRDAGFEYKKGETWDRLVHQGIQSASRRIAAFASMIHRRTCRSRSCAIFQKETNSWDMWMPSANSMACAASSIGKQPVLVIRKLQKVCCRSTTTDLLFLADRNFRSCLCGLRS
jgi:hypothetical protein